MLHIRVVTTPGLTGRLLDVTVEQVDASLASTTGATTAIGSPASEIVPVWEMVEAAIRGGAVYSPSFFGLLAMAGLIGAVGILTNSQILIVPSPRPAPAPSSGYSFP